MSINFPNDPATNPGNGGSWTDPDGNVWSVEIVAGEAIWTMQEAEVSEEPVIEWTLTANGSTDYIFSGTGFAGTETDPVVYVVRGQTYKFTNGMGAHPFQIQSTQGTSGTAYNDGITNNAVSNGTLTWEVRMDAPSTLYYQCTSHADMNGTIYVLDVSSSGTGGSSGSGGGGLTTSSPWAPSDLTLSMWLDADDTSTITETGGAVSAWNDKTSNAFNVAQASATNQPALTANALNGKSVITFDGTNDYLSVPPSIQLQPMTIALVCKANSTASSGGSGGRSYVFDGYTSSGRALLALDGNNVGYPQMYAGSWLGDNTSTFDTDAHIFVLTFNGGSSSLKFDGGTAVTGTAGTQGLTNGVTLGANFDQTADWFNGAIAEFIVLPAVGSDDQEKLEGYLAHKWGLEASLPAAHPYKSEAPVNEVTTSLPSGTADGEALIWENGTWAVGPVIGGVDYTPSGDADFNDVSLLLLANGTNGSTTFTDSSSNSLSLTASGSVQISTTQYKFGGSSAYFNGQDKIEAPSDPNFAFGTDDFTVECWYRPNSRIGTSPRIWSFGASEWGNNDVFILNDRDSATSTKFGVFVYAFSSSGTVLTSTTNVTDGTWYHLAVVRSGNTLSLFVDGVEEDTYTNSGSVSSSASIPFKIGATSSGSQLDGYIDDLRVTKGVARYTAAFTPPTAELPTTAGTPVTIPYSIDNLDDVDTSTVAPTDGQALLWYNTASKWKPGSIAASGGSSTRTQVSATTASIADGASADLTISGTGKAGQLLSIETDAAAWVTLYVSQATRTADASRTETTDPSPGSGVLAEVITTGAQTVLSTPSTAFFNDEATPASELYLKVVNKSGASAAISVTLKVIPIEV